MSNLTVKNVPPDLCERLKQSAAANRRSLNSEIITYLERGLRGRKVDPETWLMRARQLRQSTNCHPITDIALRTAKRTGRP